MKILSASFDRSIKAPGPGQEPRRYMCTEHMGKSWLELEYDASASLLKVTLLADRSHVAFVPRERIEILTPLPGDVEVFGVPEKPVAKK